MWMRPLGLLGATLVLVGAVAGGVGYLNVYNAQSNEIQCELFPPPGVQNPCASDFTNYNNATAQLQMYLGAEYILAGTGVGCLLVAVVGILSRPPGETRGPQVPGPTGPPPR